MANLTLSPQGDTHVEGARLMFEQFLRGKVVPETETEQEPSLGYALYMEPDLVPIRPHWLNYVIQQVAWPVPEFWMKGSIFMGNAALMRRTTNVPNKYHINGNALYNLHSPDFQHFYYDQVRPFVMKRHGGKSANAYDTDIYEYLHDDQTYASTHQVMHKFQYTDLLQNQWHTPWSAPDLAAKFPNTVLVHGGVRKE